MVLHHETDGDFGGIEGVSAARLGIFDNHLRVVAQALRVSHISVVLAAQQLSKATPSWQRLEDYSTDGGGYDREA